jgi:acetyl-CoA carboxylase carboxyltransferase component
MGPQAAINAVFFNQVQAIDDEQERAAFVEKLRREYREEIDVLHLASELVVDAVIAPEDLRVELVRRYAFYADRRREWPAKHNAVTPV